MKSKKKATRKKKVAKSKTLQRVYKTRTAKSNKNSKAAKPKDKLSNGAGHFYEKCGKTPVWWHGEFYFWKEGKYIRKPDGQIKAKIVQYLRAKGNTAKPNIVNQIMLNLQGIALLDDETQPNSWRNGVEGPRVMVANNGNISFDDLNSDGRPKLLPHTPNYFSLTKLPYDYDPLAECPNWLKFLNEVMDGDAKRILLLQQWAGYLLMQTLKEQRFLICVGEGANGKGVYFMVILEMVGPENCSSVPLSRFGDRFSLYSTYGKLVNATNEGSREISLHAETILKQYTAGDQMTFERKYKDAFSAKPTAKVMIATNELPCFTDRSQGVWRRMLLVPFEVTIPEKRQNKNLAEELKGELPGIFNWAYDGMVNLEKKGFVKPAKSIAAIKQYRQDVNPAKAFLLDEYETRPDAKGIACKILFERYKKWCDSNNYRPLNAANFGKEVKRTFSKAKKSRLGSRTCRTLYYVGLSRKKL